MLVFVQMCISPMTKDEEHSMCQNYTCVIFTITVFITIVIPLSGLALRLGLSVCTVIKTQAWLSHTDTLAMWVVILTDVCTAVPAL
jgi:hypothetical protein